MMQALEFKPFYVCACGKSHTDNLMIASAYVCPLCTGALQLKENISKQVSLNAFLKLDEDKLSGMRKMVLDEFKKGPGTDSEVMQRLGYSDPNKVRPRRKELYNMGLLRVNCKRVCGVTGLVVIEWIYINYGG